MDNQKQEQIKEKQFSFSKEELAHLESVYTIIQSLNWGMQHFIITRVYPRLGLPPAIMSRYDVQTGILAVPEKDLEELTKQMEAQKAEQKTEPAKEEAK